MLQDGLLIGSAPDYALSFKGEEIFHKVSVVMWCEKIATSPISLVDRRLSGLRKKVMDFVSAKTDYGKLVAGVSDFAVCEVPERNIKITVNISWNRRLSPSSIFAIRELYLKIFYGDGGTAKVSRNATEGGPNIK